MKQIEETQGEFAGWRFWPGEAFEARTAGPFYTMRHADKSVVCAFRAAAKHMNGGGVVHGGALMTFADYSLFAFAHAEIGEENYGLTVAFTSEFLSGPRQGQLIESRGEVLRAGGSLIFVRGLVSADGVPALNFSGTIKRIKVKA